MGGSKDIFRTAAGPGQPPRATGQGDIQGSFFSKFKVKICAFRQNKALTLQYYSVDKWKFCTVQSIRTDTIVWQTEFVMCSLAK